MARLRSVSASARVRTLPPGIESASGKPCVAERSQGRLSARGSGTSGDDHGRVFQTDVMHSTLFSYHGGDRIADFSVISVVAAGTFGEVYLVRDLSGARLALKLLKGDPGYEMSAISRLRQKVGDEPGMVQIHHIGEFGGRVYYTMDAADNLAANGAKYCPDTLENRLAFRGALNAFEAIDIAEVLASALDALHAHGLVHRDLKPSNVIFKDGKPLLADLGLIASADGGVAGTPGFMPTETLPVDAFEAHRSRDFFALGKVLYCMLTNENADRFPILPKSYSVREVAALRKVWLKACAPRPSHRFAEGCDFIEALRAARRELCGITVRRRMGVSAALVVAAVAAVLTIAVTCFFSLRPSAEDEGEETAVYVNIEEVDGEYRVFCCFNSAGDLDPMSVSNRRKAAALTKDALRKYRNLPSDMTVKVRDAKRDREPERNGGMLLYHYRMPVASCVDVGAK